jgi:hypothetical protein
MRALILLLAVLYCTTAEILAYEADGRAYVPVVVLVAVEDAGFTEGVEVRLIETAEDPDAAHNDAIIRNIHKNLGKPVKTDHNSTAVVWMLSRWHQSSQPDSYRRNLKRRLIVGPLDAPFFDGAIRDVIENLKEAESSTGPISVIVKLKKEAVAQKLGNGDAKIEPSAPPNSRPTRE